MADPLLDDEADEQAGSSADGGDGGGGAAVAAAVGAAQVGRADKMPCLPVLFASCAMGNQARCRSGPDHVKNAFWSAIYMFVRPTLPCSCQLQLNGQCNCHSVVPTSCTAGCHHGHAG